MGMQLKSQVVSIIYNSFGGMIQRYKRGMLIVVSRTDSYGKILKCEERIRALGYETDVLLNEARYFEKAMHVVLLGWRRRSDNPERELYCQPSALISWSETQIIDFLSSYVFDRDIDRDDVHDIITIGVLRSNNAHVLKKEVDLLLGEILEGRKACLIGEFKKGFGPVGATQMLLEVDAHAI